MTFALLLGSVSFFGPEDTCQYAHLAATVITVGCVMLAFVALLRMVVRGRSFWMVVFWLFLGPTLRAAAPTFLAAAGHADIAQCLSHGP